MRIADLTFTLVEGPIPPGNYHGGPRMAGAGGARQLGVLAIETDEGVRGHSFLGGSRQGADPSPPPLSEYLKPMVMGRNSLDIGAIWDDPYRQASRLASLRAIVAIDVALWDLVERNKTGVLS